MLTNSASNVKPLLCLHLIDDRRYPTKGRSHGAGPKIIVVAKVLAFGLHVNMAIDRAGKNKLACCIDTSFSRQVSTYGRRFFRQKSLYPLEIRSHHFIIRPSVITRSYIKWKSPLFL